MDKYVSLATAPANVVYLNRSQAEQDKRYKQLIPYVLVVHQGTVLRYQRGAGGEKRLHGLYSIGIGGHISDTDNELFSQGPLGYTDGMRREVKEELGIEANNAPAVALINDDATEVGYVHFGVVHIMTLANPELPGGKKGIRSPEFIPISEAVKETSNYESWSAFCLQNIDMLLARAAQKPV